MFTQHRDVKHIVSIFQLIWYLQVICHTPICSRILQGPIYLGPAKLYLIYEPSHILYIWHLEHNQVPNLKLYMPHPFIRVALLINLYSLLHVLNNHNYLHSMSYHILSKKYTLPPHSNIELIYKSVVQGIKGCHIKTLLIVVITWRPY